MQDNAVETNQAVAEHTRLTHLSEHLANERTYLAYLRTAVSLMSFGIAINRFSMYLEQSNGTPSGERLGGKLVSSEQLGIGMVFLGLVLLVWAAIHYDMVLRRIDEQDFRARPRPIYILSVLVFIFGASSVVWLFLG
jgi:putative membrane protein